LSELFAKEKLVFNSERRCHAFKKYSKQIKEHISPENDLRNIVKSKQYEEWLKTLRCRLDLLA